MSAPWIPTVTVSEEPGPVAPPANIDQAAVVLGPTSGGSVGLSPLYNSAASMKSALGYGDTIDAASYITDPINPQRQPAGPVRIYKTASTNAGSYGTFDDSGVVGTAVWDVDASVHPYGTFDARVRVVDPGILGIDGVTLQWALDEVPTWSPKTPLGTDLSFTIPGSNAKFTFAPSTTNAAYVALAVELRADTLAHLANVTAHDGADTSAAQVALAASSVPATVTASTAVVNLVLAALVSHVTNITSVHEGPDLVAHTALAALSAAIDAKTGIDLAIALKGILNTHEAAALALSATALMGSTASIAAPTTYTAAANFLAGGVALMDAQPRRPTVTTGAGGTPSDMAATAALSGFDLDGNAQNETLTLSQTSGTATAAKAYKGTGLQMIFATADGTGATFTVGIDKGVHESADSTNTITSADPTYGTMLAGDVGRVRTVAPTPSTADIDAAATALATSSYDFSQILFAFPMNAATAAHVTLLLNTLRDRGKRVEATIYTRGPNEGESEADWGAAIETDFASFKDDRIEKKEGMPLLLTDPATARVYLRPWAPAYFARMLSQPRRTWAGCPNDGALDGVQLYDANDVLIGHDETGDVFTGLGDADGGGNRFGCVFRGPTPQTRLSVYTTVPWTAYDTGINDPAKIAMVRRIANAAERAAVAVSFSDLGGSVFYDDDPQNPASTTKTLWADVREALHSTLFDVVSAEMQDDIENAKDADPETGLVRVSPTITVASNLATVPITLTLKVGAWIIKIPLTVKIQ